MHPNHDKSRREPTITRQSRFIMQRLACNTCASWVRSSTNRERESWRRHPYQMLSFEKDDTHTPSSSFCVVVLSGDHRPPLTAVPPFKEPIGTPVAHRRQYFHQIIVESSSSIFCPKTDNTRQQWRCRHSGQSVNLQKAIDFDLCVCIQQLEQPPHETRYK